jgi:ABC-type transport system substrate-binding protein
LERPLWENGVYGGKEALAQAQALLDGAGFKDPDGKGPKLRFEMVLKTGKDPAEIVAAKALGVMWLPLGVLVRVEIVANPWLVSTDGSQVPVIGFVDISRRGSADDAGSLFIRTPLWRRLDTWFFRKNVAGVEPFGDSGFFSLLSVSKK